MSFAGRHGLCVPVAVLSAMRTQREYAGWGRVGTVSLYQGDVHVHTALDLDGQFYDSASPTGTTLDEMIGYFRSKVDYLNTPLGWSVRHDEMSLSVAQYWQSVPPGGPGDRNPFAVPRAVIEDMVETMLPWWLEDRYRSGNRRIIATGVRHTRQNYW